VRVTSCVEKGNPKVFNGNSLEIKEGDTLRVTGWYNVGPTDERILPAPAGPHMGVMSYMYAVFAPATEPPTPSPPVPSKCEVELDADCAPWTSKVECDACAEKHSSDLQKAGCTRAEVIAFCKKE
jgi:hypothetical protein